MEIQEVSNIFAVSSSPSLRVLSLSQFLVSAHTESIQKPLVCSWFHTVTVDSNPTKPRGQTPCFELCLLEIYFYYKVVRIKGAVRESPCGTVKHLQRICDAWTPGLVTIQEPSPLL